jgi:hypothetical protein
MVPVLAASWQDATTASGHNACPAPKTRSARPTCPPAVPATAPHIRISRPGARRSQRKTGDSVTRAHHQECHRHHPPVRSARRGERADGIGKLAIGVRLLQSRGKCPAADHQHGSRGGGDHPPHQGTARTITSVVADGVQLQQPGLRCGRRTPPPCPAFAVSQAGGSADPGSVFTFDHKEGPADHAGQL